MSIFYLFPVKGDMPIHLLETIIVKRLEYLKAVIKSQFLVYNEYVVEGSVYDIVGHFMLCVVAVLESRVDFTRFIINAEKMLFKRRLKSMYSYDLRCFAKKVLRIIKKLPKELDFMGPLTILCQHFMLRDIAHHVSTMCHNNCSYYNLGVNFKHCLAFVGTKQVALKNGIAYIPCCKWKLYLSQLFEVNLSNKLYDTDLDNLKNDPRIIELQHKVRTITRPLNEKPSINVLKSEEIDSTAKMFPPCMLNLHHHLRKKHRLTHNQRFFYTLFLKDLGMSFDEAVIFWRNEYQQAPNGKSNCCHNWDKDEKKFVYGIRHMYGLEGRKKQYMCRSCSQIQSSDTSYSEGGCPFKSFDNEKMNQILNVRETGQLLSQIEEFKAHGKYTSACLVYLQKIIAEKGFIKHGDFSYYNFTPVTYYSIYRNATSVCIKQSV